MIAICVTDDHAVIRDGLRAIFEDEPDMRWAGGFDKASELLDALHDLPCDVLVLDLGMPDRQGEQVLGDLLQRRPELRVLVYSMQPEDARAARLVRAGAWGYLCKTRPVEEVLGAVRAIAGGTPHVPDTLQRHLHADAPDLAAPHDGLTAREREVFDLLVAGQTPSEIGAALGLASSTVSTHIRSIREKLDCPSIGAIVRYAARHGLMTGA